MNKDHLGLAIFTKVVYSHQGTITKNNNKQLASAFYLHTPCTKVKHSFFSVYNQSRGTK